MSDNQEQLKKAVMDHMKDIDPELIGQEPTAIIQEKRTIDPEVAKKLGVSLPKGPVQEVTVFTFKSTAVAEDGAKIPIVKRVTVDSKGNIIKSSGN